MKANLFNSILCASLLVFAVGCGKSKSSGGSRSLPYYGNNLTSQQLQTNLNNWYNGKTEGNRALGYMKVEKRQQNNQNCDSIDVFGLFDIPYCTYSYNSSSNSGTLVGVAENLTLVHNDGISIKDRGNAELDSLFNGTAGQIVQVTSAGQQAVRVDVVSGNSMTSYIIDMSYHSKLNPVVKTVSSQSGAVSTFTKATCINAFAQYGLPAGCTIY